MNLPAEVSAFVGRAGMSDDVVALLDARRLVTLTGPGGVGKTRLALRAARQAGRLFPDGTWLVELSQLRDPELLGLTITELLGARGTPTRPQNEVLAGRIGERRVLLVLDTCEHLLDACAELVTTLLSRCPGLRVLATSREPLDVMGEHVHPVPPMGLDAPLLFVERARAVLPEFEVTDERLALIAEICERLDGLPLAIELAAARLRHLSLTDLARRLDDRFRVLARRRPPPLPHRHHALWTTIGWSHELCTPEERLLWARLSVFAGSFERGLAEEVCHDERLGAGRIFPLLCRLVDKSIVVREERRYRLLDSVREYGAEWLRELGEQGPARDRHARVLLELTRGAEAGWRGPEQLTWVGRLCSELPDLRLALDHSLRADPPLALELAGGLWALWSACGLHREGSYYLGRALAANPWPSPERTKALWVAAWVDIEHFDAAAALARLDGVDHAYADHMIGVAHFVNGDDERAARSFDLALTRRDQLDAAGPGHTLTTAQLGICLARLGDARAEQVLRACVRRCADSGERWSRSIAHYGLALLLHERGDVDGAARENRESLRIKKDFGDVPGAVLGIELQAWLVAARGEGSRAAELLGAVDNLWRTAGLQALSLPYWAEGHMRCEAETRELVGPSAFDAAFTHGAALDVLSAYELAINT
ncbi:ATP-binding protein [Nonomuraea soli]|uniref:Non-specific serine/threonine protein kinase n=1 Tax=Nonomuraea soli TaxID=1032476 RepID=A0A7W0CTT8_9ACTN|nr:NB-ARC domain-containing protein [Nonomuraea soli]MBA2897117.1 non-specific serine/threonine protein kinase [Nonomuraea soli]